MVRRLSSAPFCGRSNAPSIGAAESTRTRSRLAHLCRRDAVVQHRRVRVVVRAAAAAVVFAVQPAGADGCRTQQRLQYAVSFVTNTNWQSYVPETTMSYLVQMAGLTVHNFVSAATGIAL